MLNTPAMMRSGSAFAIKLRTCLAPMFKCRAELQHPARQALKKLTWLLRDLVGFGDLKSKIRIRGASLSSVGEEIGEPSDIVAKHNCSPARNGGVRLLFPLRQLSDMMQHDERDVRLHGNPLHYLNQECDCIRGVFITVMETTYCVQERQVVPMKEIAQITAEFCPLALPDKSNALPRAWEDTQPLFQHPGDLVTAESDRIGGP